MLNNATVSLTYFFNAVKLEPNVQMMLNNYGIALQKAGKTMEAAVAFKRAESREIIAGRDKSEKTGFRSVAKYTLHPCPVCISHEVCNTLYFDAFKLIQLRRTKGHFLN